jgi:hypothetical protein
MFVLCTLVVNAPLLPHVLRATALDVVPAARRSLRRKALTALDDHTDSTVASLRRQEDEMFAGVDWARVRDTTRVRAAPEFASFEGPPERAPRPAHAPPGAAMSHAAGDAWTTLAGTPAAVGAWLGRCARRARVKKTSSVDCSRPNQPGLRSAKSMASLFLDDGGGASAASRRDRLFGRAIAVSKDDTAAAGDGSGPSTPPDDGDTDLEAASPRGWEEDHQMTIDGSSVPFLPIRKVVAPVEAAGADGDEEAAAGSDADAPAPSARSPARAPPPPPPLAASILVYTEGGLLPSPDLFEADPGDPAVSVASVAAAATRARASLSRPSPTRTSLTRPATATPAPTAPRLDAMWREQEAAMGASLTSPTTSLRAARAPTRHRSVFEAFNIARGSEAADAGGGGTAEPLSSSGRRSSGGGSAHGADDARRALAAASLDGLDSRTTWSAGVTRGVSPLVALRASGGGAAAVAALEAPTEAELGGGSAGGGAPRRAPRAVSFASSRSATATSSGGGSDRGGDTLPATAGRALKSALSRVASARPRGSGTHVEELRVRVATALKRHFHAKRAAGLLSARATRVLDTACSEAVDAPSLPLRPWAAVEREVTARFTSRWLARSAVAARRLKAAIAGPPRARSLLASLRRALAWPLGKLCRLLLWQLSRLMLVACEAAMEMMLALSFSPATAFAAARGAGDPFYEAAADCVADECDTAMHQVWLFLHDREAEAPERFQVGGMDRGARARGAARAARGRPPFPPPPLLQAIQTYRATMAVMRRQAAFVAEAFDTGAVDADERDALLAPLAAREAALERRGPFWRAPSPVDVLKELPFCRGSDAVAKFFFARSALRVHPSGAVGATSRPGGRDGFIVVVSGLLRVSSGGRAGGRADVYLGCGGLTGLHSALTGIEWGKWAAVAEGNALGRGPLVVHVSQAAVDEVRERSAGRRREERTGEGRGRRRPPTPPLLHSRQPGLPPSGGRHVPHGVPLCRGAREAAPHGVPARGADKSGGGEWRWGWGRRHHLHPSG